MGPYCETRNVKELFQAASYLFHAYYLGGNKWRTKGDKLAFLTVKDLLRDNWTERAATEIASEVRGREISWAGKE